MHLIEVQNLPMLDMLLELSKKRRGMLAKRDTSTTEISSMSRWVSIDNSYALLPS